MTTEKLILAWGMCAVAMFLTVLVATLLLALVTILRSAF